MLDFCNVESCGRLLTSPEELAKDKCRYCLRGIEPSRANYDNTYRETMSYTTPKPTTKKTKAKGKAVRVEAVVEITKPDKPLDLAKLDPISKAYLEEGAKASAREEAEAGSE